MSTESTATETIKIQGRHVVEKIEALVREGNVRRVVVKDSRGKVLLDIPVTVSVLAVPMLAALGAVAAYAADCSIELERADHGSDRAMTRSEDTRTTARPSQDHLIRKEGEATMSDHKKLLECYVERYNAGDLDGCMDLYAEDAAQLMPDGLFEGRAKIRERLARELQAFPDVQFSFGNFVEQGDSFADEWIFTGTHTGPLTLPDGTELAPTGRRVEMKGMEFVRVRDGKIIVDNLYYDNFTVAAQLGLVPQPTSATA